MALLQARPALRDDGRRGFTLVEMLVAVAVLAILVSVAGIPASADSDESALDAAQLQVQDAFGTAQTLAYSLAVPHGVVFDLVGERFAVVAQDGQPARDPLTHAAYEIDFTRTEQPRGVTIATASFGATGTAGIFNGEGVPVAGGSLTLSRGHLRRTLVLDPATGKLTTP